MMDPLKQYSECHWQSHVTFCLFVLIVFSSLTARSIGLAGAVVVGVGVILVPVRMYIHILSMMVINYSICSALKHFINSHSGGKLTAPVCDIHTLIHSLGQTFHLRFLPHANCSGIRANIQEYKSPALFSIDHSGIMNKSLKEMNREGWGVWKTVLLMNLNLWPNLFGTRKLQICRKTFKSYCLYTRSVIYSMQYISGQIPYKSSETQILCRIIRSIYKWKGCVCVWLRSEIMAAG